MSTVRIPAKKIMEPDMTIMDIDNIWDYIDMYVEEDRYKEPEEKSSLFIDDEDDYDDKYDGSWDDYGEDPDWEEDWGSDYRDAFEDDPEACWGREW